VNVENMPYQIRDNGRTRAALRQFVVEADDLREDGRYWRLKAEVVVLQEEATNAPKVDRREEILKVNVEDVSTIPMSNRIADDRASSYESVSKLVSKALRTAYLVKTVLQQGGKPPLQEHEIVVGRQNRAVPAAALGDLEPSVLSGVWFLVKNVCECGGLEVKHFRDIAKACSCLQTS